MKKRNKTLILISTIFVVVAIIALIVGFALSGFDIIGWFSSKWAILLYILLGAYAFVVIMWIVVPYIMKKL